MIKSLSELALNISEQEYRDINCLSYSAIAKYEKGGFGAISHLYDIQESDALTFGSVVDTLVTEGEEVFKTKFAVANIKLPSEALTLIGMTLLHENEAQTLEEIDDDVILSLCNRLEYCAKMSDAVRIRKVREGCTDYYNNVRECQGKTVITNEMYLEAINTVNALKSHPLVGKYLSKTDGNTEFLYQLKFKTNLDGLEIKFMPDLLIVMHASKTIIPVDLKTSSFPEYDFPKRYLENRYDIQARLYYRALTKVLSEDDYFKNFKLSTFKFIVVNKFSLNPLVFRDDKCMVSGDIILDFKSGRKTILRDPIIIGKELQEYLDNSADVPVGIEKNQSNNIYERLKLL